MFSTRCLHMDFITARMLQHQSPSTISLTTTIFCSYSTQACLGSRQLYMATSCHYVSDCSAITTCRSMDQFISQRSLLIWQAIKSGQYAMTNYTWATLSKKIAANSKQQCTKYSLKHVRIPFYRSWSKILTPNISWTNLHDASGNGSHAATTTCMHTSRWLNFKHVFVHAIFINISLGACHKQQQIKICCTPLISINPSVSLSFCTKLVITL